MQTRGITEGIFTIEKYDAAVEQELKKFEEQQQELLQRLDYQMVLAQHATNPDAKLMHEETAEALAREIHERQEHFQRKFANDVSTFKNGLLNAGITLMWQLMTGASAVHFDNTNSRLVVGTSSTAFSAAHTAVQSALATLTMDSGYPSTSAQSTTWRATAGTSVANGSWQEFAITNGTTSMNRAVSNQGTKTSSDIWVPSLTISLS